jgi:hypothetical protein
MCVFVFAIIGRHFIAGGRRERSGVKTDRGCDPACDRRLSNPEVTAHSVFMRTSLITLILAGAGAVTVAASLPATAAAQTRGKSRWKEIGKTSSGNAVLVDPSSMKTVNGITTIRVEVKFTPPVKTPKGDWYLSRHIALFDCAQKTVGAKESIYYGDAAATKVMEKKVIAQPGLGSPIGGSMTKVALDYVCRAP